VNCYFILNNGLAFSYRERLRLFNQFLNIVGIFFIKSLEIFAYFLVFIIASHANFDVCKIPFNYMMFEQIENKIDITLIKTLTHFNEYLRIFWQIESVAIVVLKRTQE